ncbi:hypothetical protein [Methyloversatilis sp.]|uniref:hypothetical protein n=1 Tax=Methyloversatilis sp. TaxID=2569862 RepID=UPI0027376533|nr:hypothetical protein [Methyloversatilis sp.]MDP2869688.1 hypothetical protein [Methyloversatilis sp.]MDP3289724.1 hypothetical protein [Methyloversatilis sp.]MDP3456300.1 hypothetical protein [Methyloversatilis sp.]MDP3579434.1 hypothetical protein [Methyloversatilis sp.]
MKPNALLIAASCCLLATAVHAADPAKGGELVVEARCESCHADKLGGDGSQIYLRKDRRVNTLAQLATQVSVCNSQLNTGWFPEDEAHVAAYLNQRYYKFR